MTELSRFFDSATYTEAQFGEFMHRIMYQDGYVASVSGYLITTQSTAPAMSVSVASGEAWVQGAWYQNTAAKTMTIEAAHATLPRWDRIILRCSWSSNSIVMAVLKGTPAASPTVPALTQTAATWEISLAWVYVAAAVVTIVNANITDSRVPAACNLGVMHMETDGSLDAASRLIHNVLDPVSAQDVATKNYAAPLASPTLTGTPRAPTAAFGTNSTQIATTEFTQAALSSWASFSPTLTWGTATPTGITTVARRAISGKTVFFAIDIQHGTSAGTTGLTITGLPGTITTTMPRLSMTAIRNHGQLGVGGTTFTSPLCYLTTSTGTLAFYTAYTTSTAGGVNIKGFYEVT